MTNHLADSTSPYLLQHANNPVDWYPWGEEALTRAKTEDKPIFLSIGYAACHWCHVMAHESFEDPATAAFMNENFINIKVDREERPDLDAIYMQATTAMTGAGGWPMSVFLTPELKPFYAGTYFPRVERYNMPSFTGLLNGLARAWKEQREEITRVSGQVSAHLAEALSANKQTEGLTTGHLDRIAQALVEGYDWGYGGWGQAPKFPQPMTIEFLLGRAARTTSGEINGRHIDPKGVEAATHALRAMARGGMYDVVGGGFARYSTDNFWRVPHFEKMLYDNALLTRAYLHAWQITSDPLFRRIVEETIGFVTRELMHSNGGFYSSLDADSEGEEGKFYTWSLEEIESLLGDEADFFKTAYGINLKGNWEGRTILQRVLDDASLAARFSIEAKEVSSRMAASHKILLAARAKRVRPGTDDKTLTGWNGLMLASVAEAGRTLNDDIYIDLATRNADFLLRSLRNKAGLHRSWRDGITSPEVFLEDYASLILGLLELYQADFNPRWYSAAADLTEEMIERFSDTEAGGFFDTPIDAERLLLRPKDLQDNATPSGNALTCEALLKLAAFSGNSKYLEFADQALKNVSAQALKYPTAFARWLSAADFALGPVKEIALIGRPDQPQFQEMLQIIRQRFRPSTIVAVASLPLPDGSPPLLDERGEVDGKVTAYVCEGFVCQLPTTSTDDLNKQLN